MQSSAATAPADGRNSRFRLPRPHGFSSHRPPPPSSAKALPDCGCCPGGPWCQRCNERAYEDTIATCDSTHIDMFKAAVPPALGSRDDRVGGGVTPAVLPPHRTCGSASGGSCSTREAPLEI